MPSCYEGHLVHLESACKHSLKRQAQIQVRIRRWPAYFSTPPRMTTKCSLRGWPRNASVMTDVGASKKGARGKVVEDLRRQILLAFWVVEELPTTFSMSGHALPLTYMPRMEDQGVTLGLPSVQTVYTLLQHDWFRTGQSPWKPPCHSVPTMKRW